MPSEENRPEEQIDFSLSRELSALLEFTPPRDGDRERNTATHTDDPVVEVEQSVEEQFTRSRTRDDSISSIEEAVPTHVWRRVRGTAKAGSNQTQSTENARRAAPGLPEPAPASGQSSYARSDVARSTGHRSLSPYSRMDAQIPSDAHSSVQDSTVSRRGARALAHGHSHQGSQIGHQFGTSIGNASEIGPLDSISQVPPCQTNLPSDTRPNRLPGHANEVPGLPINSTTPVTAGDDSTMSGDQSNLSAENIARL